ncbi:MAG: HD domain-containing protein [Candidatus Borkfalkia sp.]
MDTVLQVIYENYKGEDREVLVRAYHYAEEAHSGQKRASGEAYFIHPCAVAKILIELGLDSATVAAAFLHDVIEDTPVTEADIRSNFGDEILGLVSGVTKLDKIVFKSREEEEAENFRKIFVAMAKDIRVIIIKLADRLHNMRTLNFFPSSVRRNGAGNAGRVYAARGQAGYFADQVRVGRSVPEIPRPRGVRISGGKYPPKLYERHISSISSSKRSKDLRREQNRGRSVRSPQTLLFHL